jgi:hypothetical protein
MKLWDFYLLFRKYSAVEIYGDLACQSIMSTGIEQLLRKATRQPSLMLRSGQTAQRTMVAGTKKAIQSVRENPEE